jgi:serine/threonine-protein kinase
MYHLLTNHPPEEARDRFLNPNNLIPPREINQEISSRTERAILWAMALHPDERPQTIEDYRQALYGDWHTITRPRGMSGRRVDYNFLDRPFERILFVVVIVLLFISFLVTII